MSEMREFHTNLIMIAIIIVLLVFLSGCSHVHREINCHWEDPSCETCIATSWTCDDKTLWWWE